LHVSARGTGAYRSATAVRRWSFTGECRRRIGTGDRPINSGVQACVPVRSDRAFELTVERFRAIASCRRIRRVQLERRAAMKFDTRGQS
jgi:hypothetical protein